MNCACERVKVVIPSDKNFYSFPVPGNGKPYFERNIGDGTVRQMNVTHIQPAVSAEKK